MKDAGTIEVERIRRLTVDSPSFAVEFVGETAAFVSAEETVLFVAPDREEHLEKLHAGVILAAAAVAGRLLTAGDDGRIVAAGAAGTTECLVADERRRWIDHVAVAGNGSLAWSIGKQAFVRSVAGAQTTIALPSSAGGIAFVPDWSTVAVAHYNGVTLQPLDSVTGPKEFSWNGLHLRPSFSPDGAVLVTAMREPSLHAWNVADGKNLATPGYLGQVCSMDWSADGRFLATSGSDRLTMLPFGTNENPLMRMPLLLAPYSSLVAAVACHPHDNIVAAGYVDGLVLLVRIPDGAEIMMKAPDAAAITAMRWSRSGRHLGIASDNGQCRVVTIGRP